MYELLNKIQSPDDVKKLDKTQLPRLCREIRQKLIRTVADNGGHLSSNLGAVELTVALHRVFSYPNDVILWDVGHQSYPHKMLTGRFDRMETIRQKDGLCGFMNRQESKYDAFTVGHASTSISAALGIAKSKEIQCQAGKVIAVIGDGALTGGMAYEALNNSGKNAGNLIVILNDNRMSISENVGAVNGYLTKLRTAPIYIKAKRDVTSMLEDIPFLGNKISGGIKLAKKSVKKAVHDQTLFEDLGFAYYGPVNGHDINGLIEVLTNAKNINKPILLHMITQKGRGYSYAEINPENYHGIGSFDIKTGAVAKKGKGFSDIFGEELCRLAKEDNRICAVTAAMPLGTGLAEFRELYPRRFFDVGIAEEHAVTFSGGLSVGGMIPVCAVYSTFLQRSYDQIIHDAVMQDVKMILAIDRAGIVGEDGATHQGVFDTAFLNNIPKLQIYSPSYYDELKVYLQRACRRGKGVIAIRYPRGAELYKPSDFNPLYHSYSVYGDKSATNAIVTYGRMFSHACLAYEKLKEQGILLKIIKLNRIKPIDFDAVKEALNCENVLFVEEGILQGGIAERFGVMLLSEQFKGKYRMNGIDNSFVAHETVSESFKVLKLDVDGIIESFLDMTKEGNANG